MKKSCVARRAGWIVLSAALAAATGCARNDSAKAGAALMTIDQVPQEKWKRVAGSRVFFGHQSVGFNIVEGIGGVLKERPNLGLKVVEWAGGQLPAGPAFVHAKCGINEKPATKIFAFSDFIKRAGAEPFDVAFFKFCYVDIGERTDAAALFEQYRSAIAALEGLNTKTVFVHVTTPLTVVQRGPKVWLKRVLGRPVGGYADNAARSRFNALLRSEYAGRRPVFDLAAIESTRADGSRETFRFQGETYEALVPEYASDGRHLNEEGQRWVAEQLLSMLAETTGSERQ